MTMNPGTKLGAFEITALLGKGGMGEVYRARDTKLGRDVAIKVLSAEVAADAEYLKRFEKEARVLASLDHPNIGAIYDFGHAIPQGGARSSAFESDAVERELDPAAGPPVHFLVMQLVEGEALSARIRRGALSVREVLPVFAQIARGLDAAHEKGLVHRDLKPANVVLAAAGGVKVLDFGIAKDLTQAEVDPNAMTTPMSSFPMTGAGMLVGTPHYMSPEQARGKPVDRRTDVWAFGCCLYEALTGDMPFQGETMTDIVAGIIHKDPEWAQLPSGLPRELDRLVRRCLEKDLRRRPSSMNDLAIALEDIETDIRAGRLETVRSGPAAGSVADAAPIRALVVLPFENLMGDAEQNYFVDGMTEALTAELSKIRALKVISRGTAMRYRKTDKSMPEIAQELGVEGLIEGSVFRAGDDIRITAQLIDGRSDVHIWSESFTGSMDSALQLQGDVALAIAKAIRVAVTPEEKKQLRTHRKPIGRDVQKVLWEANYAFNQQNPRGYRDAVRLYERATIMDPECTPAFVGLAAAHWVPSILGIVRPVEGLAKAEEAARRALEIDPDSHQSQFTAGYIEMMYRHDWDKSRKHFDRAVELSPSSAEAHSGLGLWHIGMLEFDAAAREEEMARTLDPTSPMHANNLGVAYGCLERYEESDAAFADAVELSPLFVLGHVNRHLMRVWSHPTPETLTEFEQLVELSGNLPLFRGNLAWAYGRLGQPAKAAAIGRALEEESATRYIPPLMLGMAFQAAGEVKKSYDWYEKSVEEREWGALYLGACPWVCEGAGRSDPRYRALLEKLRLPEPAIRRALDPAGLWPKTVRTTSAALAEALAPKRGMQWVLSAVAGVVLVLAGYLAGSLREPLQALPENKPADARRIASLAVLPLDNLMEDPEQEYFVDGMTEALTAELSKIGALKVISRTSVMRYKDSDKTAGEIAEELGVEGLIEGSVMRVGDEVRITVQLIDAETDAHLWAETYDNTLDNVFKLHSEVALAIAMEVQAKVTPGEASRLANADAVNSAAHEEYLKALHYYSQQTREGIRACIEHLDKSTELDPNFAKAWAFLPRVLGDSAAWGFTDGEESYRKSKAAAERAVALAPDLAMARYAMGTALWHVDWDWKGAEGEFRRALELEPNDGELRFNYAWMLLVEGRVDEALQQFSEGIERSPLSLPLMWSKSYALGNVRRYDEAIAIADELLRLNPDYSAALLSKGKSLLYRGEYDAAIGLLSRVEQLSGSGNSGSKLAIAYIGAGDAARARQILAEMLENQAGEFQQDSTIASVYAHLNEFDRAFEHLDKAVRERHWSVLELRADPIYEPLRSDPRYWALIDRIGYPPLPENNPIVTLERQYREAIVTGADAAIRRIAVLPFANISGDLEQEYFVDGMTEALTMELAKIRAMSVVSRTSAMQFKGVLRPMHEIAEELGVDALVEGSVFRAGDQVRITAQLIDGRTDEHLWADRYDGTMDDILNLQSKVALAIAKEVSGAVTPEEQEVLSTSRTIDPVAYEAYLRGMYFWNRRALLDSIPYFEQAIELAPDFALAYSGLSIAYGLLSSLELTEPVEGFRRARENAEHALQLDPDLPDAQLAIAWMLVWDKGEWKTAEDRFRTIQQKFPDYAPAFYWHATVLGYQRRFDEAFEKLDAATALDPIAVPVTRLRTLILSMAGRYEEAIETGLRHLLVAPEDAQAIGCVAHAYVELGRHDDARELLAQSPYDPEFGGALISIPYTELGLEADGEALLASLMEKSKTEYVSTRAIVLTLLGLGRVDEAIEAIEREVATGKTARLKLLSSPLFDRFADDARFETLRRQIESENN